MQHAFLCNLWYKQKERRGHGFHRNYYLTRDLVIPTNFKIMKTVKEIVFVIFTLVLFGACNDTTDKIEPIKVTPYQTNFHLEAIVMESNADPRDELHLEFTEISNCNVAESMLVVLDSELRILNEHNDFIVREGNIDFLIPNSGGYMVANFDGKGIISDDHFVLNASLDVVYGTGAFWAYEGELSLKVVGVQTADQLMQYSIEIDGYLGNEIPIAD